MENVDFKWGYRKDTPNVIFKVRFVKSNGTIEYYLPEDDRRHSAWSDEYVLIDENEVPTERKCEYDELYKRLKFITETTP